METIAFAFFFVVGTIFLYSGIKLLKFFTLKKTNKQYDYEIIEDDGITYEKVVERYEQE